MAVAFRVALVAGLLCACSDTTPTPGSLTVTISGLPSGTAADVTVTPPGQHLTATATIGNLAPGAYTITAATVAGYAPTVIGSPATVVAGQTATASVTYALIATTGSLTVSVNGLPGGTDGDVTVAGPGGFSQHLTATQTLSALTPGSYTVTAQTVGSYTASVSGSPATVTAGQTASASVTYSLPPTTGNLSVAVTGSTNADIDIAGPAGYSHHLAAAATLTGLAPGSYTITAHDIAGYTATGVTGSPATVAAGQTSSATVTYTAIPPGSLTVTVSGLPGGTDADVTVEGPGAYSHPVTATMTLTGLTPGSYTVTASAVTGYAPTVTGSPATVTSGNTASVSVDYAPVPTTGDLTITVSGGLASHTTVDGPGGFNYTLSTSPTTLFGLDPGSYTITAATYTSGGVQFTAVVSGSPATVTAGGTANATVTYTPAAPTATTLTPDNGKGTAAFSVAINGSNFVAGATTVSFGGVAGTSVNVVTSAFLSVQAPIHAPGVVDVIVTTAGGSTDPLPFSYWRTTFYSVPTLHAGVGGMVAGPDGRLWFSERNKGKVGAVTTAGVVTEYPLTQATSDPPDIAVGADGNLWCSDYANKQLIRITTAGVVTEFPIGNTCQTFGIAPGPGGTIWYTAIGCPTTGGRAQHRIGKIDTANTAGGFTDYDNGTANPFGMTLGPDGKVWFAEYNLFKVAASTATGTITDYTTTGQPTFLTAGPDGNVWAGSGKLAVVTPAGVVTEHSTITPTGDVEAHLTADDANGIWYSARGGGGKIGWMDATTFANKEYPLNALPSGIAFGPDGAIWVLVENAGTQATSVVKFER